MLVNTLSAVRYSLDAIRDEVRCLVEQGAISKCQPIYLLLEHFPVRDWHSLENELEQNGFLLRDRIGDLLACERWLND